MKVGDFMRIEYRIGNMFDDYADPVIFLAHGCNAQGVMGSGVAKELRARHPWAYNRYRGVYDADGLSLGQVVAAGNTENQRSIFVFNCITQNMYGRDGTRYANYGAVQKCVRMIDGYMKDRQVLDKSIPDVRMSMIGSSLGGGDWNVISTIIEREARHFRPLVYDLTP